MSSWWSLDSCCFSEHFQSSPLAFCILQNQCVVFRPKHLWGLLERPWGPRQAVHLGEGSHLQSQLLLVPRILPCGTPT